MTLQSIAPDVFRYTSAHPAGVREALFKINHEGKPEIRRELDDYLSSIDDETVLRARRDPIFQQMTKGDPDLDRAARLWAAERLVNVEVDQTRLNALRQESVGSRNPYHSSLFSDLNPDAVGLVKVSEMGFDISKFTSAKGAGLMLASRGAPNSTYWLAPYLVQLPDACEPRVRIDPLLWGEKEAFPRMMHMMRLYGRPLDWNRIGALREIDQGRWVADSAFSKNEITEYAWTPRDNEVHLELEELPQQTDSGLVGSRYLHAIYSPIDSKITHVDGAIRVYTHDEQRERLSRHLTSVGKEGTRAKVFRADGDIPLDAFSNIAATFYVWNYDVQAYFSGKMPPAAEGTGVLHMGDKEDEG